MADDTGKEVKDDDAVPYWDPAWEIPFDTPEELAAASIRAGMRAIRRMNEEDPWY